MVQFLSVAGPLIAGAAAIAIVIVELPFAPCESVIVTTTFANVPETVGVPEIVPEFSPIVRPAGSPVADQVYGGVPVPVGCNVQVAYGRLISPTGHVVGTMPGGALIVTG